MGFVKGLKIRLRLQRRRHKHLLVLAVTLVLAFAGVFVFWPQELTSALKYIAEPDSRCGPLPRFVCKWFAGSEPENVPFDPLTLRALRPPTDAGDDDTLPLPAANPQQPKIDYINAQYKGLRAKKLLLGHRFYQDVMKTVIGAKPKLTKIGRYGPAGSCHSERFESGALHHPLFSEEYLALFLQLSDDELADLAASHKYVVDHLPEHAPSGLYAGDGIVFVGGGKFNWLTVLSIRTLREGGCKLPVEILIPLLEEYELELCSRIFPAMNARCIHLPTVLFGDNVLLALHLNFKGYQYKSLAILLSSFENVLLMDSDNLATAPPDHMFAKEPFTLRGMIVWPDYWRRSTSPSFYKIAGVEISKEKLHPRYDEGFGEYVDQSPAENINWFTDVAYHERVGAIPDPSSESGQLMISKKTHMKAVLLAFYYNSYGPNYYYPMFSQGAQGEGDKETFLAAATILKKPFYQVGRFLMALGNNRDNKFNGKGMGQFDAVEDYEWNKKKLELRKLLPADQYEEAMHKLPEPNLLFVHANYPKLNPWVLRLDGETVDKEGTRYRLYGTGVKERTGTDIEIVSWVHMHKLVCELGLTFEVFKDVERKDLCKEIEDHLAFLQLTKLP